MLLWLSFANNVFTLLRAIILPFCDAECIIVFIVVFMIVFMIVFIIVFIIVFLLLRPSYLSFLC